MSRTVPQEVKDRMIEDYLGGMSAPKLEIKYSVSARCFFKAMRAAGIKSRPTCQPLYATDNSYFSNINTERQAYWLGWISADGHLDCKKDVLSFCLASVDEGHLYKFKDDTKSEGPISRHQTRLKTTGKTYEGSRFRCCSHEWTSALRSYGLDSNKSFSCVPWQGPEHLLSHYWRGFFDGNGHISFTAKTCAMGMCGTLAMMESFSDFLLSRTGHKSIPRAKGAIWVLVRNGKRGARQAVSILYEGASIWLDRKKETADRLLALPYQIPRKKRERRSKNKMLTAQPS